MTLPSPQASLLDWALFYAEIGWPVFPVVGKAKSPLTSNGLYDASTDPGQIREWWSRWPSANIGCPCGPKEFRRGDRVGRGADHDVVDLEPNGIPVAKEKGDAVQWVTYRVTTPSGGVHAFVKCRNDVKNAVKPIEGIDVRTAGGYTLLPPSYVIEDEKNYEGWYSWVRFPNGDALPDMPAWLVELAHKKAKSGGAKLDSLTFAKDQRNNSLFAYGARLRNEGMTEAEILGAVRSVNAERCQPPLDDKECQDIAKSAMRYEPRAQRQPQPVVTAESSPDEFPLTDAGNAERMIAWYGENLRYVPAWGRWLHWNGWKWSTDEVSNAVPYQIALKTIRRIQELAVNVDDSDKRKQLAKWGFGCETKGRIEAMVTLASKIEAVVTPTSVLDAYPGMLNLRNGVYDLANGQLLAHNRSLMLTSGIDLPYDEMAGCPTWHKFLHRVMDGRAELISYLWKAIGYSLSGDVSEQTFFFLYGPTGNNGKSTFIETLIQLFGDYAKETPTETLMAKYGDPGISNDLARLKDARFVAAPETEDGKRLNEGLIKRLTGGDTITARFMRAEFFDFRPQFKIWITGNHRPTIKGTDDAIWRRVALIPFDVTIPESERDPDLKDKLHEEFPGILNWAIQGHKHWREDRLGKPASLVMAVEEYREAEDVLGHFLGESVERGPDFSIKASDLYAAYKAWCQRTGTRCVSLTVFGESMRNRGDGSVPRRGCKFYDGIRLIDDSWEGVYRGSSDD